MFSGITKTSGKNPAFTRGDYPEMRQKKTQQDLINEGKKFKFSVLKKPYLGGTYQEMEYEATPLGSGSNMTPLAKFPNIKGFDGVPIINDTGIVKHPCTCGGSCVGSLKEIEQMWEQIATEIKEGKLKSDAASMNNRVNELTKNFFNTVLVGLSDSYTCSGTGIEQLGKFLICGGNEMFGNIASSIGSDYLTFELWYIPSFSNEKNCTSIQRCKCGFIVLNIDCGKGFINCNEPRDVFITVCAGTKPVKIYPAQGQECGTLVIVNEDGSPATDTILRNGSLDFKTTGNCCGTIVWSVSGTGASITQGGVLSASGSACGSLTVTASCPECGTSDTQSVRVTDGGRWVLVDTITYGTFNYPAETFCTCISGKSKNIYAGQVGDDTCQSCDGCGFTGWLQVTFLCNGTGSYCSFPVGNYEFGCVRYKFMYEWQC